VRFNRRLKDVYAELPTGKTDIHTLKPSSLKIEESEWLSTEEAAEYLRVSVGRLRNMVSGGLIPRYKLGTSNRFRREELRGLLLGKAKGGYKWE
jgi:excisionase family DNA binding protein